MSLLKGGKKIHSIITDNLIVLAPVTMKCTKRRIHPIAPCSRGSETKVVSFELNTEMGKYVLLLFSPISAVSIFARLSNGGVNVALHTSVTSGHFGFLCIYFCIIYIFMSFFAMH